MMLQGPSSAGKTTLSKALQVSLDEYWWALGADDITHMQPAWQDSGWWEPPPGEKSHPSWDPEIRLQRWLDGYWQCLATIAKTGSNVIAAGGWLQTEWLFQLAHAVEGIDAYCVGVYCPLEEVERREVSRGDRGIGYARSQYDVVHLHAPYDVAVDTSAQTTEESISAIEAMLKSPPEISFFERIRGSNEYAAWLGQHSQFSHTQ